MPKYVKEVYFMWRKIFISISLIILIILGIIAFNNIKNEKNNASENLIENEVEISSTYVKDDCLNEWDDYAKTVEEELKQTSGNISDDEKHYIVKEKDGNIVIYYINEKDEEILYKVTDISVEYLSKEDVESLKQGIDVYGIQNLNQLIEDFE